MFAASPSSRRLAAALAISAFTHALFSALVRPGAGGRNAADVHALRFPLTISARLAPPEPQLPPAASDLEHETAAAAESPPEQKKRERAVPSIRAAASKAPTAGPAEIPDPTYYAARELDVYPALTAALDLRRASSNGAADMNGRVVLLVLIDAEGRVDDVSVVDAQPAGLFDEEAQRALRAVRFKPALKHGRAVKSRIHVHISYGAESTSR